jgi:hypothetical protein
MVPTYHRSRQGRMFRLQRTCERSAEGGTRYVLRAFLVRSDDPFSQAAPMAEQTRDFNADALADKLRHHLAVQTTEAIFEQLWQQLRLELDATDLAA